MTFTCNNEKDVKKQVKKLLDAHNWFWYMPPANGYGRSGISDFNALRDGVFLAVETKFGSNKPTPLQIGYLNSINAENGFGFVVNEKTLDDFARWLDLFDNTVNTVASQGTVDDNAGADMLNAMKAMTELLA